MARRDVARVAFALVIASAACGGAQEEEHSAVDNFTTMPTARPAADSAPKPEIKKEDDLTQDQKEQMEIALRRGGTKVENCSRVVPDSPPGEAEVTVVFDGKKGRCVDVNVGAPWVGTPAENCIKRAFIDEIVVPFEGTLEVPYKVKIVKADATPPGKDKGKKK